MSDNVIGFPKPTDIIDDRAFEEIVPKISKSCSVEICQYCGRKYVRTASKYLYCMSPPCFVKGALNAISSAQVEVDEQTED